MVISRPTGVPLTCLRVSVDFHLLSEVNFDWVGPELGPLLWGDERGFWALKKQESGTQLSDKQLDEELKRVLQPARAEASAEAAEDQLGDICRCEQSELKEVLRPSAELPLSLPGIHLLSDLHHLQGYTQIHTSIEEVIGPAGVPWDAARGVYEAVMTCDVTLATF